MAKKTKTVVLNIVGTVNKRLQLTEKDSYDLRTSNKKINEDLFEFLKIRNILGDEELPPGTRYLIRGGSSISGCPMHHSLSGTVPKKIFLKGAKKKRRVLPRYVTDKIRVLDIFATNHLRSY